MFGGDELLRTLAARQLGPSRTQFRTSATPLVNGADSSSSSMDRRIGQAMLKLGKYNEMETVHSDLVELAGMMQSDDSLDPADLIADLTSVIDSVNQAIEQYSLHTIPNSNAICTLTVTAGAGGADSEDWASMLSSMYAAHARRHRMRLEWLENGPRTFAFHAQGAYPFGQYWLESGVHRLVRISPFNSAGKRHTSFAAVDVQKMTEEVGGGEVDMKDVEVQVFRASGAGGQHVNTTDSAVRLVHLPTGITVQCQQERSQHRNKAFALRMLRQRLYERQEQANQQAKLAHRQSQSTNAFGAQHQVRSYVLHPYQQVKDHQSGAVTNRVDDVLGGGMALDALMEEARVRWSEIRAREDFEAFIKEWEFNRTK
ncbi:hypothetical protein BCR44DRAFT_1487801 [Catenaria anguillulae PL171]|uniref:Prokaryotic-type class I peptide chain release factors domain-containing protein n=1 Tax=Catenaria anguillulae PL171 TaxID=765915 RepID=A0A1Y2HA30_9FUNG|nr:hypothetical protein BCR44DRAFT_1487801 [Catenaria anguillulae PL171]